MSEMLVSSGFNFEGYSIVKYLGIYTGECALGTGFLSSVGAGVSDILGKNSEMYSDKLAQAKDFALQTLYERVRVAGGNAVIGLEINYTRFSGDIMGVIATGTAVRIVRDSKSVTDVSDVELPVTKTNLKSPFRPISVFLEPYVQGSKASLEITETASSDTCEISGIQADLAVITIFDETLSFNDLYFVDFNKNTKWRCKSGMAEFKMDPSVIERAKSAFVTIKKYIKDGAVVDVPVDCMELQENEPDLDSGEEVNKVEILHEAEDLSTASEVINYLYENVPWMEPEILSQLEDIANCERIYGNMHDEIVRKLKDYLM